MFCRRTLSLSGDLQLAQTRSGAQEAVPASIAVPVSIVHSICVKVQRWYVTALDGTTPA